jgi:electron transfer flavoprotein alpha subunit
VVVLSPLDTPDAGSLNSASVVIAIGGGAASEAAVLAAQTLASLLHGVLGATRVLTDRGIVPHDLQIGTTGVSVAPEVYLSFGVSGALQHLQGVVMPERSITVNTDPNAAMVKSSTLAYITDAEQVLTELVSELTLDTEIKAQSS